MRLLVFPGNRHGEIALRFSRNEKRVIRARVIFMPRVESAPHPEIYRILRFSLSFPHSIVVVANFLSFMYLQFHRGVPPRAKDCEKYNSTRAYSRRRRCDG